MRATLSGLFVIGSTLFLCAPVLAVGPGKDTLTRNNVQISQCLADTVTAAWSLDSIFGEPTVNGSFKWTGNAKCKLHYSTKLLLQISKSGKTAYIEVSPVLPKANEAYGFNTTGSPDWSSTVCLYNGNQKTECLEESAAKRLWKSGKITDFMFIWQD
ncbi:MAG: hypothetical protein V7711_11495 [Pseudomonadales bacterium]